MLKKLIKYELKATARTFLPLYVVLLSVATMNRLLFVLNQTWKTPMALGMIVFVSIMVGMFVITFVMMIQRFYQNLLSQEGYLMFTLPVRTWQLIAGKLAVSILWIVASALVAMMSVFIIASTQFVMTMLQSLMEICSLISRYMNMSTLLFMAESLTLALVTLAFGILIVYASIAVGHLFNRHRAIASVGAFIGLSTVSQVLMTVVSPQLDIVRVELDIAEYMTPAVHASLLYSILLVGLQALGFFLLTNFILSKRLNLE